jgi:hypothetical protein
MEETPQPQPATNPAPAASEDLKTTAQIETIEGKNDLKPEEHPSIPAAQVEDVNAAIAAEAKVKLEARIAELKQYAGKTFKPKGSDGSHTIKVLTYAGVGIIGARKFHDFLVESKNPGARWRAHATEFLNTHEETQSAATVQPEIQ